MTPPAKMPVQGSCPVKFIFNFLFSSPGSREIAYTEVPHARKLPFQLK